MKFDKRLERSSLALSDLPRYLRECRERLGLTQEEVAHRLGTQRSAISRLESEGYNPTLGLLVKYARSIGLVLRIRTLEVKK